MEVDVKTPKLDEIAARINTHLRCFEADPKINKNTKRDRTGLSDYYNAGSSASGSRVFVTYISYQGRTSLTKKLALLYLAWLDAGNVGRHWKALEVNRGE